MPPNRAWESVVLARSTQTVNKSIYLRRQQQQEQTRCYRLASFSILPMMLTRFVFPPSFLSVRKIMQFPTERRRPSLHKSNISPSILNVRTRLNQCFPPSTPPQNEERRLNESIIPVTFHLEPSQGSSLILSL